MVMVTMLGMVMVTLLGMLGSLQHKGQVVCRGSLDSHSRRGRGLGVVIVTPCVPLPCRTWKTLIKRGNLVNSQ